MTTKTKKQNKPTTVKRDDFPHEFGNWLGTYSWMYYCTFSTQYPLTMFSARKSMERLFDYLKDNYPQMRIVWAAEPFDVKYGYHLHALVSLTNDGFIDYEHGQSILINAWQVVTQTRPSSKDVYAYLKRYDKNRKGRFYIAKYIGRHNSDFGLLGDFK